MFIIVAIFSVAWALHLVPARLAPVPARFAAPVAALAATVGAGTPMAEPPARLARRSPASNATLRVDEGVAAPVAALATMIDEPSAAVPSAPQALAVFSWSTIPSPYPQRVAAARPDGAPPNEGVVTHAFATAGSAVRSALKRAF
jgi:hypothetical protein